MKTKLLSIAFMMLTVCGMQSQDTISSEIPKRVDTRPISFPFWMVREIALDLEEKQQLELETHLYALEVESYRKLLQSMEVKEQQRQHQLELLGKNISLLQTQLQAEKQSGKPAGTVVWSLRLLAALGVGYVLGSF